MTQEQIAAIKELLKEYDPDFDSELSHWEWGNCDDSFSYGAESGEQYILSKLNKIINKDQ